MKKRVISLLILAALAANLAACGDEKTPSKETTSSGNETTSSADDSSPFEKDDLPDNLNFGGKKVTWFIGDYNAAYWDDFYAEEQNGSRINDAVWKCRRNVEDRLGVEFDYFRKQVTWEERNDIKTTVAASVMAGDNAYDIYAGRSLVDLVAEDKKYLLELSSLDYINLDKPWWNKSVIEMMPGDEVYELTGDGTISLMKHAFCVFFNQTMLDSLGISENMYDLVRSGKWTIDKLTEYAKLGYSDVNGNTEPDFGDKFGLTFGDTNKYLGFQMALGGVTALKGKDGYEIFVNDERMINAFDAAYSLVQKTEGVLLPGSNNKDNPLAVEAFGGNYADKTFIEGNALFTMSLAGDAAALIGDAKFGYGLMPYPKYDEAQENYVTGNQRQAYFAALGYADKELVGAVLEAWSSECYRILQPEYFETTLKARYSADDDMTEMFDLIRETIKIDVSNYFGSIVGSMVDPMKNLITEKKEGQWASEIAGKIGNWETKFAEVWELFS